IDGNEGSARNQKQEKHQAGDGPPQTPSQCTRGSQGRWRNSQRHTSQRRTVFTPEANLFVFDGAVFVLLDRQCLFHTVGRILPMTIGMSTLRKQSKYFACSVANRPISTKRGKKM